MFHNGIIHMTFNIKIRSCSSKMFVIAVCVLFLLKIKPLRTVPTFVSAHMFCASGKQWFKRARALGLTLTQLTTPPSSRLTLKQNFPTVTKSILMNLYLNQEYQNSIISLTNKCQILPAENLAVIFRNLY